MHHDRAMLTPSSDSISYVAIFSSSAVMQINANPQVSLKPRSRVRNSYIGYLLFGLF